MVNQIEQTLADIEFSLAVIREALEHADLVRVGGENRVLERQLMRLDKQIAARGLSVSDAERVAPRLAAALAQYRELGDRLQIDRDQVSAALTQSRKGRTVVTHYLDSSEP